MFLQNIVHINSRNFIYHHITTFNGLIEIPPKQLNRFIVLVYLHVVNRRVLNTCLLAVCIIRKQILKNPIIIIKDSTIVFVPQTTWRIPHNQIIINRIGSRNSMLFCPIITFSRNLSFGNFIQKS